MQDAVLGEFEHGGKENERQPRGHVCPCPRQLNAGYDDDEGIEKVERGIDSTGHVKQGRGKSDIHEDLQPDLDPGVMPQDQQKDLKERNGIPENNDGDKTPNWDVGLREL